MRKRYRTSRIASSDNYELSRKLHSQYLENWHQENIEIIQEISVVKKKYVKMFGELIPISEEEFKFHNTLVCI